MVQLEPTKGGYYLWRYLPSLPAAATFCILFLASAAVVGWRMYRTRTWFCTAFVIGCVFEFVGYGARAACYERTGELIPYIIQNFFILLGPALFAASIYMTLSRIIRLTHGEEQALIQPRNLTRTFVGGDIASFIIQGSAAGLMVQSDLAPIGKGIVIAGLLVQIIMFGLFVCTAILWHRRRRQMPTRRSSGRDVPWRRWLWMLYTVSALIMLRSIFRVAEFAMGYGGYLLSNEWPLYVFDAVLMWIVTVVFALRYPGRVQQAKESSGSDTELRER